MTSGNLEQVKLEAPPSDPSSKNNPSEEKARLKKIRQMQATERKRNHRLRDPVANRLNDLRARVRRVCRIKNGFVDPYWVEQECQRRLLDRYNKSISSNSTSNFLFNLPSTPVSLPVSHSVSPHFSVSVPTPQCVQFFPQASVATELLETSCNRCVPCSVSSSNFSSPAPTKQLPSLSDELGAVLGLIKLKNGFIPAGF